MKNFVIREPVLSFPMSDDYKFVIGIIDCFSFNYPLVSKANLSRLYCCEKMKKRKKSRENSELKSTFFDFHVFHPCFPKLIFCSQPDLAQEYF